MHHGKTPYSHGLGLGTNATHPATATSPATPNSTPEQLQEIRNRLRNSGNSQSTQIGMVLNELADLMTEAVPRMRQVADDLREENQSAEQEVRFLSSNGSGWLLICCTE